MMDSQKLVGSGPVRWRHFLAHIDNEYQTEHLLDHHNDNDGDEGSG